MIIFHSSSTLQFIKTKKKWIHCIAILHGYQRLKNGQGGRWPFLNDFIFSIWNGRRLKNFRPSINLALKSTYFCFFENCISLFPSSDGEWRRNLPLGFKARLFRKKVALLLTAAAASASLWKCPFFIST